MKNFSKIALLTVLSFLTTSQVFTETPEDKAAPLAAAAPAAPKTDPTPLPAETLAKPIDDPKLTEVAPPAEPKKEEDKVVPASVAPEKELAAPAAPTKSSWTVKSVLSGAISSVKGLFTSKSTPEVKKEEPKPTTADPAEKELVAPPVEPAVKTTEPLTEEQKKFLVASPFKPSSTLAAAAGIKPPVAPGLGAALQEGFDDAKSAWRDKQTLKKETEQKDIDVESKKPLDITVEDTPDEKPASPKEIEAATAEIKATANPTMEAEENIRKYWQEKNSSKRKEKIAAVAAISFFTGGIIGVTVVLPFVLRSLAKQLDKAEEEHLKKLQAEALGAQAKLDALGKEATTLDKLMVGQLGLNPDRLYPESDFNKARGKEDERPTFTKLFRLLDNDPQKFLDAVENLREKEVAGLITDREKKQLGIIRNLRPEDIAPLGFFGSLAKYFGFPNKNETLEKIKSSWGKKYSSEEIAELKKKHGATTETGEPGKKTEDTQKLKTTPPTEEPIDAAKKPKTPEELASETAAKKQSLLDSGYPEQVVEKMLSQEAINQTLKKKGTIIPEMATLDQIIQPTKTVIPDLPEPEKKEKTLPSPTAPQPEKIADPLENEEIKQLPPRPSTAAASVKREAKKGDATKAPDELIEEVEKTIPVKDKTVPLPEVIAPIEPDKAPAPDASTVPAKAPDLVAASSTLDQTKVPPPAPVEPAPKVVVSEKTPPLSPEAETEKTANLAFDAARKALDEAIKIPVNDSDPKAKAEKTKKIQEAKESLSIAEGNLKRAQEAARDESELDATKKKSTQEIVKTTDQIINPTELATVIAKTQSQFKELPPAPTLEDQKIPAATDDNWPPKVSTQLISSKNQMSPTAESTQKAVGVVTEEIKQNAPIVAFSQQSGSTMKAVPQAPIELHLKSAISQPMPVEPPNVALTANEKAAAASERREAQQIAPEDSIKALQAQITEETQRPTQKTSPRQREIDRAISYEGDRPNPDNDFELRRSVSDNIWNLAQQSKAQRLPQTSLTDPTQSIPQTPRGGFNPADQARRFADQVGRPLAEEQKKAEIIANAKRLGDQIKPILLEQQRAGATNPALFQAPQERLKAVISGTAWNGQPTSLPPSKPLKVTEANGFWTASGGTIQEQTAEADRRRIMSSSQLSPAVIRPEDIQRMFSTNSPLQRNSSFSNLQKSR